MLHYTVWCVGACGAVFCDVMRAVCAVHAVHAVRFFVTPQIITPAPHHSIFYRLDALPDA